MTYDALPCIQCSGTMMNHVEGCIMLNDKGTPLKEYTPPTLLQLRLENHVAQAAAKWFELETTCNEYAKQVKVCDDKHVSELIEVLGRKAVLLLKKE